MAEISVVVPVYNVEKYLNKCVDSILGQTFTDFEILIVNDGSTDSSPQIVENYDGGDIVLNKDLILFISTSV